MKLNSRLVFEYLGWLILGLVFLILSRGYPQFFENIFLFSLFFLYVLILPGRFLASFFKMADQDWLGKTLVSLALSLGFYLILAFLGIFLGLKLTNLLLIYGLLLIVLYFISLIYSLRKPEKNPSIIKFTWQDFLYLIPVVFGGFIIYFVALKGTNFNGDPYFHLAIIRKAFEGSILSPRDLAFTKTGFINPAYAYPVWQVFLAAAAKFCQLDPLKLWTQILPVLTLVSLVVWYWFLRAIFPQKVWAILAWVIFATVIFYPGIGYLFSRLAVPDTLGQFILFPLALALFCHYIFVKRNFVLFLSIIILSVVMLVSHGPHYFYFILTMIVFGLFYLVFGRKDHDYKINLSKLFKIFLACIIPLILIIILIEIQSKTFSESLAEFFKANPLRPGQVGFNRLSLLARYSYLLLPLTFLFIREKRILFILSIMSLVPIICWTPLRDFFSKFLSPIFVERLEDNTSLYFLVLALVLGLLLVLIERWLQSFTAFWRNFLTISLGLFFIFLVILEIETATLTNFSYTLFYSKSIAAFISVHLIWLFLGSLFLCGLIYLFSRFVLKPSLPLERLDFKNLTINFLLILIIGFLFFAPSLEYLRVYYQNPVKIEGQKYFLGALNNDQNALSFVKNLSPKSVILANHEISRSLSVLTCQYMAYNLGSADENKLMRIFDPQIPDEEKLALLSSSKYPIDYIYLSNVDSPNQIFFDRFERIFFPIYLNQQAIIYEVPEI